MTGAPSGAGRSGANDGPGERLRSWFACLGVGRRQAADAVGESLKFAGWPVARARSQPCPRHSVILMPASAEPGTVPNGNS